MISYKTALMKKYRYPSSKGYLSTEDLFDCALTQLNEIAKAINKTVKDAGEEDFIKTSTRQETLAKLQLEVVLDVIAEKIEQRDQANLVKARAAEKQKLLALLDSKKDEALSALSVEELEKQLAALS